MHFLVRLCFGDGFLIGGGFVVDVSVPPQEILQGGKILADDVSVPVDGEVADLVAVGRCPQVGRRCAELLGDGFDQCFPVGRVGGNGPGGKPPLFFCMPLLTLNGHKVNGLWAHNANKVFTRGFSSRRRS